MKKLALVVFSLVLLSGCFPSTSGIVHSSSKDAITAIESKDSLILVIGTTQCGSCKEFSEVMKQITEQYDIRIAEVFIDEEESETDPNTQEVRYPDFEELQQYIGQVGATPSVFFINNGLIKGTFTGAVSYDTFKSKLEKYGFLPEETKQQSEE
ncbi:MAG: thioredoxin family protein [Erysipelotrichaceae bacterium]|jgi:predicted bacteriocin transport accessory protein|nr:thioredoxin family protein [Erysipelotrichaceae bacterium]MCI9523749.1 thioredoxin family protein [Erysipelotrichaceae bacterium]